MSQIGEIVKWETPRSKLGLHILKEEGLTDLEIDKTAAL
jgi:hypothetical protein